jgi:hypothetical protein
MKKTINEEIGEIKNLINFFTGKKNREQEDEDTRFTCTDCGEKEYGMYMVNNDLWNEYGTGRETLCLSCLKKRIGRELTPDDFRGYKDTPVNQYNSEVSNIINSQTNV